MKMQLQIEKKYSYTVLGLVFRYARLKAGLSLRDLGELANISHTLIANIETGKVVPNPDTLKDLFTILHVTYRDDDELINQFQTIYNRVFTKLYIAQYKDVEVDMQHLLEHEEVYLNSIAIVDYSLLRFLHAVLADTVTPYLRANMDLLKRVSGLFSKRQQQIRHLIIGIDFYNQGLFNDAYNELVEATKIGDVKLDPLVQLFMVKSNVKMYKFMDAQQLAEKTIKEFEEDLNYSRAMELRLELAKSHMAVRKFKDSISYLEKVYAFGVQFQSEYFINQCHIHYAWIAMLQEQIEDGLSHLSKVTMPNSKSVFVEMYFAYKRNDIGHIETLYNNYKENFAKPHRVREEALFNVILYEYGVIDYNLEDYEQALETIIEIGKKSHDLEVLNYGYTSLINLCKQRRKYKKALELSEEARSIRNIGLS